MKIPKKFVFAFLVLAIALLACSGTGSSPTSADLFVVVGNYASHFAGNGNGDGLLLDQFRKENKVSLYVQIANDREMKDFKDQMVSNTEGAPDIMIADDSLLADNLQNVKLIASHHVGIAIRNNVVDSLGLQGNVIPFADFVQYSKNGQLLVAGSNALAGYDSAEFFFSTMAWCSNTDAANLTAEIIQQEYVRQCGKEIYDHVKSTNGSSDAAKLVLNSGSYNSLIAFDSALMGNNGLNAQLGSGNFFKFFYFKEATAKAKVAIGTKDFGKNQAKKDTANLLIEYFLSDNSQKEINLAGFTEGSSALVEHFDTAFKPEWGVNSNPTGVQIVNPPLSNVANNALLIYRDMYKRAIEIDILVDNSGSTGNQDVNVTLPANFKAEDLDRYCGKNQGDYEAIRKDPYYNEGEPFQYSITRVQAIACGVETFSNSDWMAANGVKPGPKDTINYWLFNDTTTASPISSSVGTNTNEAGQFVVNLLGSTHYQPDLNVVASNINSQFFPFMAFQGTNMFDAAYLVNEQINARYDPNVDYYLVILTDGENTGGWSGGNYYDYWYNNQKSNIVLTGIQFGGNGGDIAAGYTQQFGGNSFEGTNNDELVKAFKAILGN